MRRELLRPSIPERLSSTSYMPPNVDVLAEYEKVGGQFENLHWHDFHKLVYVSGGSGVHMMNGVAHEIRPGVAFLLAPSDFHAWLPGEDGCTLYNVLFSTRVLTPFLESAVFDAAGLRHGALVAPDMTSLEPLMEAMVRESERLVRADAKLSLTCLVQYLLIEFIRGADAGAALCPKRTSGAHDGVRWALTYMEQHYRDPLTLSQVAAEARLSPNYFSQMFHEFTGITFQEHLQALRARFACSLLRATDMSITDVCHACGFRVLSHFERAFKAQFGMSPRAWRRESREADMSASAAAGT
jgi:AraC-like DNA-binding protein